jgi:SEC-C motif-containing protein
MNCPCYNKNSPAEKAIDYRACCRPFIEGEQLPKTPEQLMRSRYSAYVVKNASYIFNTYALASQKSQSIQEIADWAKDSIWLSLEIVNTKLLTLPEQSHPSVEFTAIYLVGKNLCKMTEKSRFIREQNQWRYLDGEMIEHDEIKSIKQNEQCPCQSGKKFKRCCAR